MTMITLIRRISERPWSIPLTRPCSGISLYDVVGFTAEEVVGVLALGCMTSLMMITPARSAVAGQQRLEEGEVGGVVQGREQVDLAAVGHGRSAKALAVDCRAAQLALGSVRAVGEPAADR
ncbi:hypothetical protein ACSCB1_23995 [Streptomyces europaeiscabiei]|uniref:Uncharacterized protein n=1 Tax=Streptomyces europaeiscabiei TaxID=146819 RepID=A0ABU4N8P8_9ACTN|nr:hypothetical protein [Streptomyces europaeiscabiei]MDX3545320.1 hypothetical protein [Streptomyces europaeiscabiei]MDX3554311.1 hypothetical protein [Streptomyces europaeiscabiei]MDX3699438.1 hypothetical protein [Streptomyces europaeiscabiei]